MAKRQVNSWPCGCWLRADSPNTCLQCVPPGHSLEAGCKPQAALTTCDVQAEQQEVPQNRQLSLHGDQIAFVSVLLTLSYKCSCNQAGVIHKRETNAAGVLTSLLVAALDEADLGPVRWPSE